MIDYKKAEQAEKLLQESGVPFMLLYQNHDDKDIMRVRGQYSAIKSFIVDSMAQTAINVCSKYGEEVAMKELMGMMTVAAQQYCAETESSVELNDKQVLQ